VTGLWKHGQRHVCLYVVSHLLALSVMTALLVSFQVLPFVVGGAILAQVSASTAPSRESERRRLSFSSPNYAWTPSR
jgi:hypothetical protein